METALLTAISLRTVAAVQALPSTSVNIEYRPPYAFWLVDVLPFVLTIALVVVAWLLLTWTKRWLRRTISDAVKQTIKEYWGGPPTPGPGGAKPPCD